MTPERERAYQATMAAWNALGECPYDQDIENAVDIIERYADYEIAACLGRLRVACGTGVSIEISESSGEPFTKEQIEILKRQGII